MKKILHICLAGRFTDGWGYQDNLLPKYHRKLGFEVYVIATENSWDKNSQLSKQKEYYNDDGVKIIRLSLKKHSKYKSKFKRFERLSYYINAVSPDILFVHGVQFCDLNIIIRYVKKHPGVTMYIDNHTDLKNSAKTFLSKKVLHGMIWKHLAQKAVPYTKKFYGVTPVRVDFLSDMYGVPKEKTELLLLGADDEKINAALSPEIRAEKRREYNLSENDFVIIAGGKIDINKSQIITLMEAVNKTENENIKLLVFGSVIKNLEEKFNKQLTDKVRYIGWKKSTDIYSEFAAADIVAFPGLHSVLWEQAVGTGKPCIFKKIPGFEHIDLGGNCLYFENDDIKHYMDVIRNAEKNISSMNKIALSGIKKFSYMEIAKQSIEIPSQ